MQPLALTFLPLGIGLWLVFYPLTKSGRTRYPGVRLTILMIGVACLVWSILSIVMAVNRIDNTLPITTLNILRMIRHYSTGYLLGAGATLYFTRNLLFIQLINERKG